MEPTFGTVIERLAYEPFGKRRFASGSDDPNNTIVPQNTRRGFTNHEHLDELTLVHMNGRVYDPVVGRFMSADPQIQDPMNLQSYNRYAYVMNNPLMYTDPSGYFSLGKFFRTAVAIAVAVYAPQFIATTSFAASAATATGLSAATIGNISAAFASGMINSNGNLQAGVVSALTAGAFNVVGNMELVQGSFESVVAHGLVGGASNALMGGDFQSGFLAAGFTQAFAPAINGVDRNNVGPSLERTMAAAVVGGTASVMGGGKFANGAMTGAFSRLFNDDAASHRATSHVLKDPESYVGRNVYLNDKGDAQCVELIKQTLGSPRTGLWAQGEAISGNLNVSPGTAIATFVNGQYPSNNSGQHAAIYLGQTNNGIIVVEQFKGLDTIQERTIPFTPPNGGFRGGLSNNGNAYSTILWK